jgi:hypothetical protein
VVVLLATTLIALRAAVPLLLERSLDSDQAIVGLMAKHLSELRTFPLFFYGQNYMLGVQAWLAAPFFLLGGPTPVMLRLPLVLLNIGVAIALLATMTRLGLRPVLALVACLPLITTTPVISDALVRPLGAAIGPFAWVLALWGLRRRPLWWGVVFCLGVLHREFVVLALPALVLAGWRTPWRWRSAEWLRAVVGSAGVWVLIDLLKRSINGYGPAGGDIDATSLTMQAKQLSLWLSLEGYATRVWDFIARAIPDMFGAGPYAVHDYHGMFSSLTAGSWWAGAALGAAVLLCAIRLAAPGNTARSSERLSMYLGLIGVLAILTYGLNGGIDVTAMPVVRYGLFVLLLPVGLLAAFFFRESHSHWRHAVAGLVTAWALFTAIDAARIVSEYRASPPANPHREMADYLVAHGIEYGYAQYWDAYIITFLAREEVVLASTGKVRISAYGPLVAAHADEAVTLVRQPCDGSRRVSVWCIER